MKENFSVFKIYYTKFCKRFEQMTPEQQAQYSETKKYFDDAFKFFQSLEIE